VLLKFKTKQNLTPHIHKVSTIVFYMMKACELNDLLMHTIDRYIPDINNNLSFLLGLCYKTEFPLLTKKYQIK